MKSVKRMLSAAIAIVMTLAVFTGCGQKEIVSDITLDEFESKVIKKVNASGKLDVTETGEGFSFVFDKYGEDQSYMTGLETFTGTANKERKLKSVTAVKDNVDVEYFMSMTASEFVSDVMNYENITARRALGDLFLVDFSNIVSLCSPDAESTDGQLEKGMSVLLNARKAPQTINGWTYSVEGDAAGNTLTMKAEYVGK